MALLATYLYIERRRRVKQTGFLVTGLAFLLMFIGSAFSTSVPQASPLLQRSRASPATWCWCCWPTPR